MPISILTQSHVRAADADEYRTDLAPLVQASRNGAGCIGYDFYVDVDDPTHFMSLQEWRQPEDYQRHFQSPHAQAHLAKWDERWRFAPAVLMLDDLSPPEQRGD